MTNPVIALVDSDCARRNRVVRQFAQDHYHVEPFEDLTEFTQIKHCQRLVLVHDEPGLVASVIGYCRSTAQVACIVAFSGQANADRVVAALRDGAIGYYDWADGEAGLLPRLGAWIDLAGQEWPRLARYYASTRLVARLTRREREVLGCITRGQSTRSISEQLLISYRTVELHRSHVLEKLIASNASDAVRIAMEAGMGS